MKNKSQKLGLKICVINTARFTTLEEFTAEVESNMLQTQQEFTGRGVDGLIEVHVLLLKSLIEKLTMKAIEDVVTSIKEKCPDAMPVRLVTIEREFSFEKMVQYSQDAQEELEKLVRQGFAECDKLAMQAQLVPVNSFRKTLH